MTFPAEFQAYITFEVGKYDFLSNTFWIIQIDQSSASNGRFANKAGKFLKCDRKTLTSFCVQERGGEKGYYDKIQIFIT